MTDRIDWRKASDDYMAEAQSLRQQLAVSEQARMEADELVLKQNAQLADRDAKAKLLWEALKQARHMIYYGEPQIGWSITRIDEVLDATKTRLTDKDVKDIVEICDDVFRQEN